MHEAKIAHPESGANTAWVPSPPAATIHALHYHYVSVASIQNGLRSTRHTVIDDILRPPLLEERKLSDKDIVRELENNAQGILGYVVHWVEGGVGCSKIPDINGIDLMEDRATLRISSQHIANWIHNGITNKEQVVEVFERMAVVVDEQNSGSPNYRNMAPDYDSSIGFQAALQLVFEGCQSPNGYTEEILHSKRREAKARYVR